MFDLISIGDCTIDHYFKIHDAHVRFSIDKAKYELHINYADKIGVDTYHQIVAGNATNHVIGISRLGLKTTFYTNIGDDGSNQRVLSRLKEEGIDTKFVKINKGMNSNISAVINFKGERTILVYHQPWSYQLPDLGKIRWIYFSSLSETFPKTNFVEQLENYLERTGTKMAFNPGTYQLKFGVKKYPKLLALTTVLFVNVAEAKTILDLKEEDEHDYKLLLKGLHRLGPQMVVLTDGGNGSWSYDGITYYRQPVFPAQVVEMTGAGDSFASGVVAGLLYGKDLPEALRWGSANSASVIEYVGPQEGLLTYEKMREKLKENSKIIAKAI